MLEFLAGYLLARVKGDREGRQVLVLAAATFLGVAAVLLGAGLFAASLGIVMAGVAVGVMGVVVGISAVVARPVQET